MLTHYHRAITMQALDGIFSPAALEVVVAANLHQDHWLYGQIGHPEYHFDQNAFEKTREYIENNRLAARSAIAAGEACPAQQAFGRLTHAAQDFYAHSNYIPRWLSRYSSGTMPPPEQVDAFDEALLVGPGLRSGKIYWPLEPFSWIPGIGRLFLPFLPRDSHAWMNLDSPARGIGFAYAFAAAVKRTVFEYERSVEGLPIESIKILGT